MTVDPWLASDPWQPKDYGRCGTKSDQRNWRTPVHAVETGVDLGKRDEKPTKTEWASADPTAVHSPGASTVSLDMLKTIANSRASRQVVAATAAALWRLERDPPSCAPCDTDALVDDRLAALRPVIEAQTMAGLATGTPQHRPPASVPTTTRLRANAARHIGFELDCHLSDLSTQEIRAMQRGVGPKMRTIPLECITLESAPARPTEHRFQPECHLEERPPLAEKTKLDESTLDPPICLSSLLTFGKQLTKTVEEMCDSATRASLETTTEIVRINNEQTHSLFGKLLTKYEHLKAGVDSLSALKSVVQSLEKRIEEAEAKSNSVDIVSMLNSAVASPSVHAPASVGRLAACKFFQRGCCAKGSSCLYSHQLPEWSEKDPVADSISLNIRPARKESILESFVRQSIEDGFPDAFVGKLVSITGLAAAHVLNGEIGKIISIHVDRGRCGVVLPSQCQKSIKFENLVFPARCHLCREEVSEFAGCPCTDSSEPPELPY